MIKDSIEVKRKIMISEGINETSVKPIIEAILDINKYDDEQEQDKREYERKPIELIVNTFGGSVYDGFALVAAMDQSKTPVHTICLGKAMSMGFIIMIAGHKRFAHPLATLMYHQISSYAWGKIEQIKEDLEEAKRLEKLNDEYILSKTNLMKKQLDEVKKLKSEWYISAEDAKKMGIIDEILQ